MAQEGYASQWIEALEGYLALAIDRVANRASCLCIWNMPAEKIEQTFARFALPILWDFAESNPFSHASGNYAGEIEWIYLVCEHIAQTAAHDYEPKVCQQSATSHLPGGIDVIVTDPPYYDAIPYSDLMDFFYIWLRRTLHGVTSRLDESFAHPLAPKWDHICNDGELIDDASRFSGDSAKSKIAYEDGMARAFTACYESLVQDGRLVIVFAHKQPDAWETLVSAIIRAGFVVDGSWPIQTERLGRMRANASAALSSSVWLVCRKRLATARPGWDTAVLEEMDANVTTKLRDFWDAGIRGPDFVWAATGPALEAYSQYPIVKKANEPGQMMSVSEFLAHARRLVVEFVVGRVISSVTGSASTDARDLDPITTYYLLHRHDFGLNPAPIGPCILYAVSCGLRDSDLTGRYDLLARGGNTSAASSNAGGIGDEDAEDEDASGETEEGSQSSGSTVKLKPWNQRKHAGLAPDSEGRPVPLIDRTHRVMQLWRVGDVTAVDTYLDDHGLRRSTLFHHLLQAIIELAPASSEERSLLESISNHLSARVSGPSIAQPILLTAEGAD